MSRFGSGPLKTVWIVPVVLAVSALPAFGVGNANLQLIKKVDNKYGGTATASSWTTVATGITAGTTTISGAGGVAPTWVPPGDYALSETGTLPGYTNGTSYECVVTLPSGGPPIILTVGDEGIALHVGEYVVCTITNTQDPITSVLDASYQVRYASNLVHGDSVVNITNTGANGAPLYGPGFGEAAGNICVNVYAFSPDEQLVSCCSCPLTPNGLVNLTANRDLVSNTLTGIQPDSIVIKLVATATGVLAGPELGILTEPSGTPTFTGSSCNNSAALAGTDQHQIASGLLAWGTTLHSDVAPVNPATMTLTETQFLPAKLSWDELKSIRERCANIIGNGSTFGICRSCRLGGLGGAKQ